MSQTVEYTWAENSVTWTLVGHPAQSADRRLHPDSWGDKTLVRVDVDVELAIPLPGFIVNGDEGRARYGYRKGLRDGSSRSRRLKPDDEVLSARLRCEFESLQAEYSGSTAARLLSPERH